MSNKLFIDVETTSLDTKKGAIIQIACIPIVDMEEKKPFVSFIKPHVDAKVELKSLQISNITENRFYTFPSQKDVLDKLIEYISSFDTGFTLAGHNVQFDKDFLFNMYCRNGKRNDFLNVFRPNNLCTLEMARARKKDIKSKMNLGALCKYFKIPLDKAHDALEDIKSTILLYDVLSGIETESERMINFYDKELSYVDLKQKYMQPKYIQLSSNGDMYMTADAVKNNNAFKFIINELWSLYGEG